MTEHMAYLLVDFQAEPSGWVAGILADMLDDVAELPLVARTLRRFYLTGEVDDSARFPHVIGWITAQMIGRAMRDGGHLARLVREAHQFADGGAGVLFFSEAACREFHVAWRGLALMGGCDNLGGAEYRRVFAEWLERGRIDEPDLFITLRANVMPEV